MGLVTLSIISKLLNARANDPIPNEPANTFPKLKFLILLIILDSMELKPSVTFEPITLKSSSLNDSLMPEPNSFIAFHTSGKLLVRPNIRPAIMKPPIAINTLEGE